MDEMAEWMLSATTNEIHDRAEKLLLEISNCNSTPLRRAFGNSCWKGFKHRNAEFIRRTRHLVQFERARAKLSRED